MQYYASAMKRAGFEMQSEVQSARMRLRKCLQRKRRVIYYEVRMTGQVTEDSWVAAPFLPMSPLTWKLIASERDHGVGSRPQLLATLP